MWSSVSCGLAARVGERAGDLIEPVGLRGRDGGRGYLSESTGLKDRDGRRGRGLDTKLATGDVGIEMKGEELSD